MNPKCLTINEVGMTRLELATPGPPDQYSTGLSYIPSIATSGGADSPDNSD